MFPFHPPPPHCAGAEPIRHILFFIYHCRVEFRFMVNFCPNTLAHPWGTHSGAFACCGTSFSATGVSTGLCPTGQKAGCFPQPAQRFAPRKPSTFAQRSAKSPPGFHSPCHGSPCSRSPAPESSASPQTHTAAGTLCAPRQAFAGRKDRCRRFPQNAPGQHNIRAASRIRQVNILHCQEFRILRAGLRQHLPKGDNCLDRCPVNLGSGLHPQQGKALAVCTRFQDD